MYRGIPSKDQLFHLTQEDQESLIATQTTDLEITKIKWTFDYLDTPTWAKITTMIEFDDRVTFSGNRRIGIVSQLEGKLRKGFNIKPFMFDIILDQ